MKTSKAKYPSDLSDEQWAILGPLIRAATGQPGTIDQRAIVNAIFYQLRTGCQWRYWPREYPNWKTVCSCFWRWQRSGLWDQVLGALQPMVRQAQGWNAYPTVAVIGSQSVKTTEKGATGI
ncbi:MAG: transposase [bacterium]|nr:transposase [bacterium]